jgi:hypothetical protein
MRNTKVKDAKEKDYKDLDEITLCRSELILFPHRVRSKEWSRNGEINCMKWRVCVALMLDGDGDSGFSFTVGLR